MGNPGALTVSPEVVVAGHLCIDLAPAFSSAPQLDPGALQEVGQLGVRPGGCVGNTAVALARLGTPVTVAANVGDDALGRLLTAELGAVDGVDLSGLVVSAGQPTSYSIVVDPPSSDRAFWHCPGSNDDFDYQSVGLRSPRVLHTGYPSLLTSALADGGACLADLLRRARAGGITTSLDLTTVDPSSASATLDWEPLLRRWLPDVDVFTPSVDSLVGVVPGVDATADGAVRAGTWAIDAGCGLAMITAGSAGMHLKGAAAARLAAAGAAFTHGLWVDVEAWMPALSVAVATTTGAGDVATAGLLRGLLSGADPIDALRGAAGVAAAYVEGGSVPAWDAVHARLLAGWATAPPPPLGWTVGSGGCLVR